MSASEVSRYGLDNRGLISGRDRNLVVVIISGVRQALHYCSGK
jgi:hypothetical protein